MDNGLSNIDVSLLKKYDKAGPRYTSYPSAPLFSPEYNDKRFEVDLITSNDENTGPISVYLHVPFCDTLCYFCGCNTVITSDRGRIGDYVDLLKQEIARTALYINRRRQVVQLAWGGGTPTSLSPAEIADLTGFFGQRFSFAPEAEVSLEIDPRGLTFDVMKAFREGGVNRISLGVQDFDERVQRAVHRIQTEAVTRQAIEWAATLGMKSVNTDLIYGLPLQTPETFQRTLEKVVEISPDRIAVFNFAYVPWMKPHQKLIHPEDLPSAEMKLMMLKRAIETFSGAGYVYIGMDHFARPEDELAVAQQQKTLYRNFQGYSTRAGTDLYAFGMSSISHFENIYAQNYKTLKEYSQAVKERRFPVQAGYRMNSDDRIRKHVIMRLMCDLEINKAEVEEKFNILFDEYFDSSLTELGEFVEAGLVRHTIEKISVEGAGRLFLRTIAMCFDAYVKAMMSKPLFSKTV